MGQLGIGVMIGILGGNEKTIDVIKKSLGKEIKEISIEGDSLLLKFENESLVLFDDGQSCCESRYMNCDDELKNYFPAIFENIEILDAPSVEDEYGEHEVQFLKITTSKGFFKVSNHNEHNGYYGGFNIVASLREKN